MKLLSFYFCLSGLIILGACSNKEETIVDQWLDKTVIIPEDLICYSLWYGYNRIFHSFIRLYYFNVCGYGRLHQLPVAIRKVA